MTTFAGGMTPTNFYAGLNYYPKVYNIKEYGAVGNNSTDDTVAIQAAINAAFAAGGGIVYFPIGIYVIGGALQTNIGGINYKSQLYIPSKAHTDQTRCCVLLRGEIFPNGNQSGGIGTSETPTSGVILKSTLQSSTAYSYIIASIGASTNFLSFNYNQCNIENIQFQYTPDGLNRATIGGVGFNDAANAVIRNVSVYPYDLNLVDSGIPQNNCVGIAMPRVFCEQACVLDTCNVGGMETGFLVGEHTSLYNTVAWTCKYAYHFGQSLNVSYCSRIIALECINAIYFTTLSIVKIDALQVEWNVQGKWYDSSYIILDAGSDGIGEISYSIVEANVGFNDAKFSKSGGTKLQCYPIAFAAASSFTVTGKRNDATALTNLLTTLAAKGIIIDSTTAS
jgi:hypothetical protein